MRHNAASVTARHSFQCYAGHATNYFVNNNGNKNENTVVHGRQTRDPTRRIVQVRDLTSPRRAGKSSESLFGGRGLDRR